MLLTSSGAGGLGRKGAVLFTLEQTRCDTLQTAHMWSCVGCSPFSWRADSPKQSATLPSTRMLSALFPFCKSAFRSAVSSAPSARWGCVLGHLVASGPPVMIQRSCNGDVLPQTSTGRSELSWPASTLWQHWQERDGACTGEVVR
jgi:hypothetical protein